VTPSTGLAVFAPRGFAPAVSAGVVGKPYSFSHAPHAIEALASLLGVSTRALILVRQVHGSRIIRAGAGADGGGEADGMITDVPDLFLCLSVADCCALLIHDPAHAAVGALHAGWRGARDGTVANGVRALQDAYGSRPGDLVVYLSPCATAPRYVVGPEVARHFPDTAQAAPGGGWTLDLPGAIRRQLETLGVRPSAIESAGVCTIADPRCHSYRREGAASGRMAAFIGLPTRPARVDPPGG
jgi:hypothetical protein